MSFWYFLISVVFTIKVKNVIWWSVRGKQMPKFPNSMNYSSGTKPVCSLTNSPLPADRGPLAERQSQMEAGAIKETMIFVKVLYYQSHIGSKE